MKTTWDTLKKKTKSVYGKHVAEVETTKGKSRKNKLAFFKSKKYFLARQ